MTGDDALRALAQDVGSHADARMVYGDPVERDGVTIVPVAQVRWGFGIGSGFRDAPMRTGGGGAIASPVGYLEIRGDTCRYVPLEPAGTRVSTSLAGFAGWVAGRVLKRRRRS